MTQGQAQVVLRQLLQPQAQSAPEEVGEWWTSAHRRSVAQAGSPCPVRL